MTFDLFFVHIRSFPLWKAFMLCWCCYVTTVCAQQPFNGNLETLDSTGVPLGWDLSYYHQNTYRVQLDSTIRRQGKYAIVIASDSAQGNSGAFVYQVPYAYRGKLLTLVGAIKTADVHDGFAGLWLRVRDANRSQLEFGSMEHQQLHGTHDWKEYYIQVPYDDFEGASIELGGMLLGKGKVWFDSLRLYLDDIPIDQAPKRLIKRQTSLQDTSYNHHSGVDTILLRGKEQEYLVLLGQLWGFLKYHHPTIAAGNYDWDIELFKILPQVLTCQNDQTLSSLFEHWVDGLGSVTVPSDTTSFVSSNIALQADYGVLFSNHLFSPQLIRKLQMIRSSSSNNRRHYYVQLASADNPVFTHEKSYDQQEYPDAGIRLLALYRYWNMIQYFCPNRALMDEPWNDVLSTFIPLVIHASDKNAYTTTFVQLISKIQDTHAFIQSPVYETILGNYRLPFRAKFIENQLTVTDYYLDTLGVQDHIKVGDVIEQINGVPVYDLVKKYAPFIPASNKATLLRELIRTYLLRGHQQTYSLLIRRDNQNLSVEQQAVEAQKVNTYMLDFGAPKGKEPYRLLQPHIGYIYCANFKASSIPDIEKLFKDTKGIIIDMRGYPTDDMTHSLAGYLKSVPSDFIRFSIGSIARPGQFTWSSPVSSGTERSDPYLGKVVVLVDEYTQSNAEFVTMSLQSRPGTCVMGRSSAGADGNVSSIPLPGDLLTFMSGIGVYYPDGTNAQRIGVQIDQEIKSTIAGVRAGRDELIDAAIQWIDK